MSDQACTSLADHIAERAGLVDIKFYIHSQGEVSAPKLCAEAAKVFDAIRAGAVEPLVLTDKGVASAT